MRKALVVALALGWLSAGFGAIDLLSPWLLHEGMQVSDVGYGTLAGVAIPAGLLAQIRGPSAAGLEQIAAAAVAFLAAGVAAGEAALVIAAGVVAAMLGVVAVASRPSRTARRRPSRTLLVLVLVACAPITHYALTMAANQRHGTPPSDAHLTMPAWAALGAAAFAVLFIALLAAARVRASLVPAFSVCVAVVVWAVTCLGYPRSAGAVDATWACAALGWAVAFALASLRQSQAVRPVPRR